jgi:hypothetical protein
MSISELFNRSNDWTKLKVDQINAENGGILKGCDMKNCTMSDCKMTSIVTKREDIVATPPAGYDRIFVSSSNILSTKKDDGTISQYQKIGELPPTVGNLNMNNYDILNTKNIDASKFIVHGSDNSHFLKGDGTTDGNEYQKVSDMSAYATKIDLNDYLPIAVAEYTYETILDATNKNNNIINNYVSNENFNTVLAGYQQKNAPIDMNNNDISNVNKINNRLVSDVYDDLDEVKSKTSNISSTSLDTTYYNGYVSSNSGYIVSGAPLAYLLTDGTWASTSASQSNLYLYKNSTNILPPPPSGHIRYNNVNLDSNCTHIYISHLTSDSLDIENVCFSNLTPLDVLYIQNKDLSSEYAKFNIISKNIIPDSYVDLTVSFNTSTVQNWANNHQLLISFFTNDVTLNSRLTTLETKAQNITASDTGSFFTKSLTHSLRSQDLFEVQNSDTSFNTITVSRELINCSKPLYSSSTITSTGGFIINGTGTSFLKSNGTTDNNSYALESSLTATNNNLANNYSTTATNNGIYATITNLTATNNNLSTNYSTTSTNNGIYATITNLNATNTNLSTNYSTTSANNLVYQKIADMNLYVTNSNLTTNYSTTATNNGIYATITNLTATNNNLSTNYTNTVNSDLKYIQKGTITNNAVPYFTSTGTLSGATKNLFVQLGDSTIQSAIDAITLGGAVGGSVTVSSGASAENIICARQNYTLCGAICPPFTQTTQLEPCNLTIGSPAFISTRVRVSHLKIVGNLIFDNSTNQQLRTYFYNCDFSGTVSFPTFSAIGTNGTAIYFDSCSFSSAMTINNQSFYTIFFTNCAFVGQSITNNQVLANITKTVFTNCSFLPTLSTLGLCILNGQNTTLTTTQANFGSIVLGGSATTLLKGNGTTLTGTGLVKGDATVLSGTVNQVVLGNGTLTTSNANSIMKGDATTLAGTASQYVMGDGSLLSNTNYPTVSSVTASMTYGSSSGTPVTATANVACIKNGTATVGILSYIFDTFTITNSTTYGWIQSTTALPVGYRPLAQQIVPVIINLGATPTMGVILIRTDGIVIISPAGFVPSLPITATGFTGDKRSATFGYGS